MSSSFGTATLRSSCSSLYFSSASASSLANLSTVRNSRSLSFAMISVSRSFRSARSFRKADCRAAASLVTIALRSSMSRTYCSRVREKSFSTQSTRSLSEPRAPCSWSSRPKRPASNLSCIVAICASNMPCSALLDSTRRLISAFNVFSSRTTVSLRTFAMLSSASFRALESLSSSIPKPSKRSLLTPNFMRTSSSPPATGISDANQKLWQPRAKRCRLAHYLLNPAATNN
mmetsp:Transcript_45804/g.74444  ORF Transcript_45804/g.74444 Transcript_45804/m.74444 type:complete len:231 (+) Transcript_45804:250-942(+)